MVDSLFGVMIFNQEVVPGDLAVVGLLIVLEGLLSIDNALVLGMLAKRLPKSMRARALSWGLIGAFVFRTLAILLAASLLKYTFIKFFGGAYLVFIAVKHLWFETGEDDEQVVLDAEGNPKLVDATTGESLDIAREDIEIEQRVPVGAELVVHNPELEALRLAETKALKSGREFEASSAGFWLFWRTVLIIEITDIAFAVDSILAALALAGTNEKKLWVVIAGGILGLVLMRFAAAVFVKLLDRFPKFELAAYLLVSVIGIKLLADWAFNSDWSFDGSTWLGAWQPWFASLEEKREQLVAAYEAWLTTSWPFGMATPNAPDLGIVIAPKLLDFHDFRRPECSGFWIIMLGCFCVGFLPRKKHKRKSE
jgi:predicted tellurium resistance membrane protein TerC